MPSRTVHFDSPAPAYLHFATTRWSVVMTARDNASPALKDALETLCKAYWYPPYAFVRRLGNSSHDAQDLTQKFFVRLLEYDWLGAVEHDRGRFRIFLIMALKRFLANEWDKERSAKRGDGQSLVPLDADFAEERFLAGPASSLPADHLYERRWASTLLDQVLARLCGEYEDDAEGRIAVKFERTTKTFKSDNLQATLPCLHGR